MTLAHAVYRDICRNVERRASVGDVIINLAWSRGVQAVLLYRLAHWCHRRRLAPVSEVLMRVSQLVFTVDIAYQAEIGPGLVLRHPMCVVIGRGCRVGCDVTIFHGVTLGNRLSGGPSRPDGFPVVEDGVLVGAGAKILGPVTIGAGSTVGANSVATSSIPPGSVAVGVPARPTETAANSPESRDPRPVSAIASRGPSRHRSGEEASVTTASPNEVRPRFPNFVVIGAAKAGTTFLASALAQHAEVHVHPHKEPHFFASEQFNAPGAWERYLSSYDYSGTESACGEASTTNAMKYLYPDPAERIAGRLPAARIIYVVRHPLDRIVSHWMDLAASSPRPTQVRGLARTVQEWPHLVDVSSYWTQLQQYRAHFEDTSILLLFFEDLVADPSTSLRRVFDFLDVDPSFQPEYAGTEKNRSLGRMTDRRWNIWSASKVYRWVRVRTPARLRALARPIIKTRHSRRPEWPSELRQHVIDRLDGEIDGILRYGGKPHDYWDLAR